MPKLPVHVPRHAETAVLRDELARLLVERATLLEVTAPALEARYHLALGALQLEVIQAECAALRLRRRLEMVQAALSRDAVPDLAAIDALLDAELAEWQRRLLAQAAQLRAADAWAAAPRLSPEAADELRTLYRRLVRRCHPDANPAGGAAARALFDQATAAYAAGDVAILRALALACECVPEHADEPEPVRAAIARLLLELSALRERFPFTLREKLDDPSWVEAEQSALRRRRDALADQRLLLEAALASLLGPDDE